MKIEKIGSLFKIMAVLSAFFIASAHAQNIGPISNHAVAVGKGAGIQGVTSVAPNTTGFPLVSNGASSDPSFQFLPVAGGGTGLTTLAIGDLLQANSTSSFARLAAVATGNVLISGGVGVASSWGKVGLTTHVSGILPLANGGTNSDLSATGGASQFLRQNTSGGAVTPVRPVCADLSDSSVYCPATRGQLPGTTTNDNASSGNIGEYVSASIVRTSAVSLTTATPANITSITITAGDWDVQGQCAYTGTATATTVLHCSLSTTSATEVSTPGSFSGFPGGNVSATDIMPSLLSQRFSVSGSTTIFMVGRADFASGTASGFGLLQARRRR